MIRSETPASLRQLERRALVLVAGQRERDVTLELLTADGIACTACHDVAELVARLREGAATALIADLQGDVPRYDRDFSQCFGPWFPIVRVHGETGRKGLFLGREGQGHIVGYSSDESNELLKFLWHHQVKDEFRWDHHWRTGDVLVWDNRCTVHSRGNFEGRRVLHRTTVGGEWPQGA